MMSTLEKMMLLLPIVFMFHDFEEIIMFRWWLRKNRSQLQQRFPSVEKFLAKRKMFSGAESGRSYLLPFPVFVYRAPHLRVDRSGIRADLWDDERL